nr:MAG TPA: hypothetical protein [Caudoviricetes sp.]
MVRYEGSVTQSKCLRLNCLILAEKKLSGQMI